ITLQVSLTNRVGDLIAGNIDLAVKIMADPPDTVVARELGAVEWRLCAAPGLVAALAVRTPDDLLRHPIVAPPPAARDYA
ncbi:LysR substrate-binding domain-containing protein, partial [Acinetobacter baumannii]|uniref:LysR substrate-binding domain-containing protein n=1 Tax=Acinetobacter baumannii TaxID=470 RepID=UPI00209036D5